MRTATISEAKQRLEELIAAARAGEDVEITQDGRRVATLSACRPEGSVEDASLAQAAGSAREALIARMVADGLMVRNPLPPDASAVDLSLPAGDSGALKLLLEEREEGW